MNRTDEQEATVPLITYEESLRLRTKAGDEIVNGQIRTAPRPTGHQAFVIETMRSQFFWQLDRRRYDIRKAAIALLIRREPLTYREPNLAIQLKEDIRIEDGLYMTSAPSLVVEVFNQGRSREKVEVLAEEYGSIGVPEMWAIDMNRPMLFRYVMNDSRLELQEEWLKGPLRPLHLPATIRVETIWDALPREPES